MRISAIVLKAFGVNQNIGLGKDTIRMEIGRFKRDPTGEKHLEKILTVASEDTFFLFFGIDLHCCAEIVCVLEAGMMRIGALDDGQMLWFDCDWWEICALIARIRGVRKAFL